MSLSFRSRAARLFAMLAVLAPSATLLFAGGVLGADDLAEASKLVRQGQYAPALERVDSFLAANPRDAQGRFLKGIILTEQNKTDLTRCAENILLARETNFPATIADLYDPENMPENLRHAHEQNDELLERIYIGRRFRNDTERLEKLFELYTKMTTVAAKAKPATKATRGIKT